MMEIAVFAAIPLALLVLLSLLGATWNIEDETPEEMGIGSGPQIAARRESIACIQRIFSPEDREFVSQQGSQRLREIYRSERTRVALYWVKRTSAEVRQIMRDHRMAARSSQNLQVAREMGLALRYVEFRLLCSLLIVTIRVFGPHALPDLATYALEISQSFGRVLEESTPKVQAGTVGLE